MNGFLIDPAARYGVTFNSFLAGDGDGFTALKDGANRVVGPVDLDALVSYVESKSAPISMSIEGRIQGP